MKSTRKTKKKELQSITVDTQNSKTTLTDSCCQSECQGIIMSKYNQSMLSSAVDKTLKRNVTKKKTKEMVKEDAKKELFEAHYKAFQYIYMHMDSYMTFMNDNNKADILYQKAKLSVVEYLTNNVNFFAKTVLGYAANIVQSFDVDGAFDVEEGYQLCALVNVQMGAIDIAYHQLASMLDVNTIEIFNKDKYIPF